MDFKVEKMPIRGSCIWNSAKGGEVNRLKRIDEKSTFFEQVFRGHIILATNASQSTLSVVIFLKQIMDLRSVFYKLNALLWSLLPLIQWFSLLCKEVIAEHWQQVCQDGYPQTFCHIPSRAAFYCATFQNSNRSGFIYHMPPHPRNLTH
ncbi:hypothetical protein Tsp_10292 [Trichinella spiralis]|uniref:hypothetical protein n=1 Tax=Trichinella spiralis TaxID=6334 RepID=UPI0001EFE1C4|nr:hypothetical protein Tsp_10292 [Trichinella spiralis]